MTDVDQWPTWTRLRECVEDEALPMVAAAMVAVMEYPEWGAFIVASLKAEAPNAGARLASTARALVAALPAAGFSDEQAGGV